jgi:hypothetical protein
LPERLAGVAYTAAERLLSNPDLSGHDFGKIAGGVASLAKADVDTGRYQSGEPAGQINVNNPQVTLQSPGQIMAEYAKQVRAQIEAAYEPPPEKLPEEGSHAKEVGILTNGHSKDVAVLGRVESQEEEGPLNGRRTDSEMGDT